MKTKRDAIEGHRSTDTPFAEPLRLNLVREGWGIVVVSVFDQEMLAMFSETSTVSPYQLRYGKQHSVLGAAGERTLSSSDGITLRAAGAHRPAKRSPITTYDSRVRMVFTRNTGGL